MAHVIAAAIQVGEWPTYGNPDPKDVDVPGLYALAMVGVDPFTGAFALPALAPGTYDVQLWDGDALVGAQGGVQVTAGETAHVDL